MNILIWIIAGIIYWIIAGVLIAIIDIRTDSKWTGKPVNFGEFYTTILLWPIPFFAMTTKGTEKIIIKALTMFMNFIELISTKRKG